MSGLGKSAKVVGKRKHLDRIREGFWNGNLVGSAEGHCGVR